ncbi:flagellar biosynthetic protein FliO [Clostridium sp. YIM B02555]|uniref:flagellar biosynthetic protein FliO n=1 Tax=Clostridium sp. YIM B02555 TaxID=2911968 RepID=UPI001EED2F40|nr:flagellar biosynthetic protein FliO [Clostridium sp. YIM B02555]
MDFELFKSLGQLIFALGVTFGLMFLSFKVMGSKYNVINNNKYIKVIDRVQITKENSILIVKIGEKGYIMTSTAGHMEKLSELSEYEIKNIEEDKKKSNEEIIKNYKQAGLKFKGMISKTIKNIGSKEEKHEK